MKFRYERRIDNMILGVIKELEKCKQEKINDLHERVLTKEIRKFMKNGNNDITGSFVKTLRDMLKNGDWVQIPYNENTNNLMVVEMGGRNFFVMF